MGNKVLFLTNMYCSKLKMSSTHIMIDNIINGLLDSGCKLMLIFISEPDEFQLLNEKYADKCDIILLKAKISRGQSKYKALLNMWKTYLIKAKLSNDCWNKINAFVDDKTVLLSHSPTLESVYIARSILAHHKIKYLQYWSDPITLGGILPEQYGIKRLPFYYLEKRSLANADEIVYGTKTLKLFQAEMFPGFASKMRYVNVSYIRKEVLPAEEKNNYITAVYSGNYYSNIRDIMPLYEAFKQLSLNIKLEIYGSSDLKLESTENVTVHSRVSPQEIQEIEAKADIMVCILNKSCIQVPGKVFYNTDLNQRILVLLDGKYADVVLEELEEYNRFDYCKNDANAIAHYLTKTDFQQPYRIGGELLDKLSPKNVAKSILGED